MIINTKPWLSTGAIKFMESFFINIPNATVLEFGCGIASMPLIKQNGVIMLDDAERERYNPLKNKLKNWKICNSEDTHDKIALTKWWFKK